MLSNCKPQGATEGARGACSSFSIPVVASSEVFGRFKATVLLMYRVLLCAIIALLINKTSMEHPLTEGSLRKRYLLVSFASSTCVGIGTYDSPSTNVCVCKNTHYGKQCENIGTKFIAVRDSYILELQLVCRTNSTKFNGRKARESCDSLPGGGWALATAIDTNTQTAILSMTSCNYHLGAIDLGLRGVFRWEYGRRRHTPVFTTSPFQCHNLDNYCPRASGEPSGGESYLMQYVIQQQGSREGWNDITIDHPDGQTHCNICERSLCNSLSDLTGLQNNNVRALGYDPGCTLSNTLPLTPTLNIETMTLVSSRSLTTTRSLMGSVTRTHIATATTSAPESHSLSRSYSVSRPTTAHTHSSTLSVTRSFTMSGRTLSASGPSPSPSLSYWGDSRTATATHSMAITPSLSTEASAGSLSPSTSAEPSKSLTRSLSIGSPSSTPSAGDSVSLSIEATESVSAAASPSVTPSSSMEITRSCGALPDGADTSTCGLLWPVDEGLEGSGLVIAQRKTLSTDGSLPDNSWCRRLGVPYRTWGGRSGSVFTLRFRANTSVVPLTPGESNLTRPFVVREASSPFAVVEHRLYLNGTDQTITLVVAYNGEDVMRSPGVARLMFPTTALRCPQPSELVYVIDPLAAPVSFLDELNKIFQQVASAISVVMAMPAVAAQMGMLSGLQDLSRCEVADLSEELEFVDSPTGMVVGAEWGAPQRGVLLGAGLLAACFTALLLSIAGCRWCVATLRGPPHDDRDNSDDLGESADSENIMNVSGGGGEGRRPWPPRFSDAVRGLGFPGVYLVLCAFLLDSVVASAVGLMLFGDGAGDRVLGAVFAVGSYAYVASLLWTSGRAQLQVEDEATSKEEAGNNPEEEKQQDALPVRDLQPVVDAPHLKDEGDDVATEPSLRHYAGDSDEFTLSEGFEHRMPERSLSLSLSLSDDRASASSVATVVQQVLPTASHAPHALSAVAAASVAANEKYQAQVEGETSAPWWRRFVSSPRWSRWFVPSAALVGDEAFMRRYGEYVADLRAVRYYRGLELLAVCLVSTLQAAKYGNKTLCTVALGIIAAVLLALVVIVLRERPMSVLFEHRCTAAALTCQLVASLIMIANTQLQETGIEAVCLAVIMVGTVVAMLQATVGMGTLVVGAVGTVRQDLRALVRDVRRERARLRSVAEAERRRLELEAQQLRQLTAGYRDGRAVDTYDVLSEPLLIAEAEEECGVEMTRVGDGEGKADATKNSDSDSDEYDGSAAAPRRGYRALPRAFRSRLYLSGTGRSDEDVLTSLLDAVVSAAVDGATTQQHTYTNEEREGDEDTDQSHHGSKKSSEGHRPSGLLWGKVRRSMLREGVNDAKPPSAKEGARAAVAEDLLLSPSSARLKSREPRASSPPDERVADFDTPTSYVAMTDPSSGGSFALLDSMPYFSSFATVAAAFDEGRARTTIEEAAEKDKAMAVAAKVAEKAHRSRYASKRITVKTAATDPLLEEECGGEQGHDRCNNNSELHDVALGAASLKGSFVFSPSWTGREEELPMEEEVCHPSALSKRKREKEPSDAVMPLSEVEKIFNAYSSLVDKGGTL